MYVSIIINKCNQNVWILNSHGQLKIFNFKITFHTTHKCCKSFVYIEKQQIVHTVYILEVKNCNESKYKNRFHPLQNQSTMMFSWNLILLQWSLFNATYYCIYRN